MMVIDNSSVLGLPAMRAAELLHPLGCGDLDAEKTLAFIIWSHLCEPGDMLASQLVDKLGPTRALGCLRSVHPEPQLLAALAQVDSADELVCSGPEGESELREACLRWKARDNNSAVVRSLELWTRLGGQIITPDSSDWPETLGDLGFGRPHVLWLRGNRSALTSLVSAVSVVGSRNISSYGQHVAQELADHLVRGGYSVVSGGAYGIDAEAHRGALAAEGVTIAVMAGGGDRLYPVGNTALLNEVMQRGCVLAELPPGNSPTRWRFLQRNRLIAALGEVTVIVEMAIRSGAKNTMNHARQIGRDVYAVPGSIVSQTARGCNIAIAEGGAKIVTGFDELLREIAGFGPDFGEQAELNALQQRVLDSLTTMPVSPTRLSIKAGTSQAETIAALGQLAALGLANSRPTGWRRTKPLSPSDPNLEG